MLIRAANVSVVLGGAFALQTRGDDEIVTRGTPTSVRRWGPTPGS